MINSMTERKTNKAYFNVTSIMSRFVLTLQYFFIKYTTVKPINLEE